MFDEVDGASVRRGAELDEDGGQGVEGVDGALGQVELVVNPCRRQLLGVL